MKKKLLFFATGIVLITILIGCGVSRAPILDMGSTIKCPPLPDGFSEEKLIGIWIAGSPDQRDTLIIKANGTYKQIIHVEFVDESPIDYESEWQSWYLEYSEDKVAYLHLDGFRFCGMNPAISCEKREGGGYDFCRDESVKMLNEGILLVLVAAEDRQLPAPELMQYHVKLHYPLGSENSWIYSLQEP